MKIRLSAMAVGAIALAAAAVAAGPAALNGLASDPVAPGNGVRGARCDGKTDDTTAILAAGRLATGIMVVPAGCKFDRERLLRDLPPEAIILDLSTINGFASEGETTKSVGILARDAATNDAQWLIGSGHHAVLNLNNFGVADSESGAARRASMLWSAGDFANGASKTGFRGAGLLQFGRETGRNEWSLSLRSLAPWRAIAARYEMWAPGERIGGPGVYRSNGQAMLVSTRGGVTGRAMPTAAYGEEITDGAVQWRFADSTDRSILRISEQGKVLFGLGDFSASFRHKVSPFHPGGNVSEWAASGPSNDVLSKLIPTDGSGAEVAVPALRASASGGLAVVDGRDYAKPIVQFDSARGMAVSWTSQVGSNATVNAGFIDVAGRSLLFVRGTGRQTIRGLAGGAAGQIVTLHFLDGNTMLANGTGVDRMHLAGSQALAATLDSVVVLRKLPTDLGGRWVEISRSIK